MRNEYSQNERTIEFKLSFRSPEEIKADLVQAEVALAELRQEIKDSYEEIMSEYELTELIKSVRSTAERALHRLDY